MSVLKTVLLLAAAGIAVYLVQDALKRVPFLKGTDTVELALMSTLVTIVLIAGYRAFFL